MSLEKPSFKAYLHDGELHIIVKNDKEHITAYSRESYHDWVRGYKVCDDVEILLTDALKHFEGFSAKREDSTNFERILWEARESVKQNAPVSEGYGVVEATVYLVWKDRKDNIVSGNFNTKEEAEQYAADLKKNKDIEDLYAFTGGKFSRKTCETFLAATQKLKI